MSSTKEVGSVHKMDVAQFPPTPPPTPPTGMPLPFVDFCTLLSDLESISARQPPLNEKRRDEVYKQTISQWLHKHQVTVTSPDVNAVIVLSSLLPGRRTDRVYSIQVPALSKYLRKCLLIGKSRWDQLDKWKIPGRGDLGECVERAQRQAENPAAYKEVTLEEVDDTLAEIARSNRFSAPSVRNRASYLNGLDTNEKLQRVYCRLQSREVKWFTRMILKDYSRLDLKEQIVVRCLDYRLPAIMKTQDSFESAIESIRNGSSEKGQLGHSGEWIRPVPKIGVKVGRAQYEKGRSIRHAVDMIGGRKMSVERKYDGEYIQIHIDLSKGKDCIQLFSKSGKDSTKDRELLHPQIKESLRIGQACCSFSMNCILEGEMVLWSDTSNDVVAFHKIRKHVNRSGSFIGTRLDSQPHGSEHLMIYYYDLLLKDDDPVINQTHSARRLLLEQVVKQTKGRAELVGRKTIRFGSPGSPKQLQEALTRAFVKRWEGLILKPCDDPYFWTKSHAKTKYSSAWIKLKKDYIPGLGDTADFAIIGASYCPVEAAKYKHEKLTWTRFYIGCLTNKYNVLHSGAKPRYDLVDSLNSCMKRPDLRRINNEGQFRAERYQHGVIIQAFDIRIRYRQYIMSTIFREPFVFEVLGSGFDKQSNQNFYTLRFPRVLKIHWDRTWKDTVDFDELQDMAERERTFSSQDAPSEMAAWARRLDQAEGGKKDAPLSWTDSEEDGYLEQTPSPTPSPTSSPQTPKSPASFAVRAGTTQKTPRVQNPRTQDDARLRQRKPLEELKSPSQKRPSSSEEDDLANKITKKVKLSPTNMFANDASPSYPSAARTRPAISKSPTRLSDITVVRKQSINRANYGSKQIPRRVVDNTSSDKDTTPDDDETPSESRTPLPQSSKMASPRPPQKSPDDHKRPSESRTPSPQSSKMASPRPPQKSPSIEPPTSSFKSPKRTSPPTLPETSTPSRPSPTLSKPGTHLALPPNPESLGKTTKIKIPSFEKSTFILNSDVSTLPYVQDFFTTNSPSTIVIQNFPPPFATFFPSPGSTDDRKEKIDTILLVNSFLEKPTGTSMKDLILSTAKATIPSGTSIAVWDWEILDELLKKTKKKQGNAIDDDDDARRRGNKKGAEEDTHYDQLFIARVEWLDSGDVLVTWADGVEKVFEKGFARRLEWAVARGMKPVWADAAAAAAGEEDE